MTRAASASSPSSPEPRHDPPTTRGDALDRPSATDVPESCPCRRRGEKGQGREPRRRSNRDGSTVGLPALEGPIESGSNRGTSSTRRATLLVNLVIYRSEAGSNAATATGGRVAGPRGSPGAGRRTYAKGVRRSPGPSLVRPPGRVATRSRASVGALFVPHGGRTSDGDPVFQGLPFAHRGRINRRLDFEGADAAEEIRIPTGHRERPDIQRDVVRSPPIGRRVGRKWGGSSASPAGAR